MAFTVKQVKAKLQEYGVPAENLDAAAEYFCSIHNTDLEAIKEQRDTYKADAEKLPGVQAELDQFKNKPDDGYKDKYEREHADFEKYKTSVEAERALVAKKSAFTEVCRDAGLNDKGIAKAMKYTDWDSVELDDAGKVKSAKDHIKALKEEWAEHVVTESTKGADTPTPPPGGGNESAFSKMSLADKMKYANENPDDQSVKEWLGT